MKKIGFDNYVKKNDSDVAKISTSANEQSSVEYYSNDVIPLILGITNNEDMRNIMEDAYDYTDVGNGTMVFSSTKNENLIIIFLSDSSSIEDVCAAASYIGFNKYGKMLGNSDGGYYRIAKWVFSCVSEYVGDEKNGF